MVINYLKILKEVIKYGPSIADAGKKIYDNTRHKFGNSSQQEKSASSITVLELDKKISQLEQNDLDQTKLISEMAKQNDNLSTLLNVLTKRLLFSISIASISFIISIYLLITSML